MVGLERARLAPINWRVVVAVAKYVQGSEVRSALIKLLWKWKDVKWRSHDLSRTVGLARFREKRDLKASSGWRRAKRCDGEETFFRSFGSFLLLFLPLSTPNPLRKANERSERSSSRLSHYLVYFLLVRYRLTSSYETPSWSHGSFSLFLALSTQSILYNFGYGRKLLPPQKAHEI